MIPILILKENAQLEAHGKAWRFDFTSPSGKNKSVFVGRSVSKIDKGIFWVEDWLAHRDGICDVIRHGFTTEIGTVIPEKIEQVEAPVEVAVAANTIKKGFFTVQSPTDSKHRTFRIKTTKKGLTLIGLMIGSNNLKDYAWFGSISGETINFWQGARYGYPSEIVSLPIGKEQITQCFAAILQDANGAGLAWARDSKRCARCARVLTTPESLDNGIGPECINFMFG